MENFSSGRDARKYHIYIVLSQTPSKFGRIIRRLDGSEYNHASISFDDKLNQLYSFGRYRNSNPVHAGIVKEYLERFTLMKVSTIKTRIYEVQVTKDQYLLGKKRILEIKHDREGYLYNLFSVLSYPLFHGFHTYKAYTCAEFVAHMLTVMGISVGETEGIHSVTPQYLSDTVEGSLVFQGNLLDYWLERQAVENDFFDETRYREVAVKSCSIAVRLIYRRIRYRNKFA